MSVFSEYNAYNFLFFLHTDAALEQDIKHFMKITIMRTLFLFTSAIFSTPLTYLKTLLSEKWNCILWCSLLLYTYDSYLLLTQFWGVEEFPGIIIFLKFHCDYSAKHSVDILRTKIRMIPQWRGRRSKRSLQENGLRIYHHTKTDKVSTALEVSGSQSSPKDRKETRYNIPPETNSPDDPISTIKCLQGSSHSEFNM